MTKHAGSVGCIVDIVNIYKAAVWIQQLQTGLQISNLSFYQDGYGIASCTSVG